MVGSGQLGPMISNEAVVIRSLTDSRSIDEARSNGDLT